jgi:cobalt-zinc-cadmium efflux system outer membrane protein
VAVAGADREAPLWSRRTDLRIAFCRMLAAQERLGAISLAVGEVDALIRILRKREEEGESSRYDRLRAEREAAELRIDVTLTLAIVADAGSNLAAFLPERTQVLRVHGELAVLSETPDLEGLDRRALGARADYRAEQRNLARFQIEKRASRRLRIPEPQVTAGLKRADVISGAPPNPFAKVVSNGATFGVNVPIPLFNNGRYEVAHYQAEQEQVNARLGVLARQIRTEAQGAREVVETRREAMNASQHEVESAGSDFTCVTQLSYQDDETGLPELLYSFRVSRAASLRLLDLKARLKEAFIQLEGVIGEEVRL